MINGVLYSVTSIVQVVKITSQSESLDGVAFVVKIGFGKKKLMK